MDISYDEPMHRKTNNLFRSAIFYNTQNATMWPLWYSWQHKYMYIVQNKQVNIVNEIIWWLNFYQTILWWKINVKFKNRLRLSLNFQHCFPSQILCVVYYVIALQIPTKNNHDKYIHVFLEDFIWNAGINTTNKRL